MKKKVNSARKVKKEGKRQEEGNEERKERRKGEWEARED